MKTRTNDRIAVSAALLVAAGLLVCGLWREWDGARELRRVTVTPHVAASAAGGSGSWPYTNADFANTRDASGSTISSTNVSRLAQVWAFRLTGKAAAGVLTFGSLIASPIVQNGVVYLQDLDSNVYALAVATGKLWWEYRCNQPERSGPGPNAVAVAVADGTVYGLTSMAAFALSATTGRMIWVNSDLLRKGQGTFGIQPQVANGRVYLASQLGPGPGGGGAARAERVKRSDALEVQHSRRPRAGRPVARRRRRRVWETPLVGSDGSVTYGIGNQYQTAAAATAHPAVDLYTDSDVNLDATTGKLRWYYQGVPYDFKDYDMQASPISARTGGAPVVIGSGKMG